MQIEMIEMHAIIFILTAIAVGGFSLKMTRTHGATLRGPSARNQCIFAADECPNSDVTFWLYKNETSTAPQQLDPLNLKSEDFEPRRPLKILLHGYVGDRNNTPNREVRPALLQTQPVHVVSVEYGSLVRNLCYVPWALYNVPIVAKCLGQLVNYLVTNGIYENEEIHLIGFSLGGQIAGLTANWVNHKLHRITALDPAGPGYHTTNNDEKLDSSDADFVDAIHTDTLIFGQFGPSAHADFYPNLNYHSVQPGCLELLGTHVCSHFRSAIYYAESITTPVGFWSYPCGNWENYFQQRCDEFSDMGNVLMGYFVDHNTTGSYFLTTNSQAPYARGQIMSSQLAVKEVPEILNKRFR